jgi:hypothetical protein
MSRSSSALRVRYSVFMYIRPAWYTCARLTKMIREFVFCRGHTRFRLRRARQRAHTQTHTAPATHSRAWP